MFSRPSTIWSEEEMRQIELVPPPKPAAARAYAGGLLAEVSVRGLARARPGVDELTRGSRPSVIYAPTSGVHGNFVDASYRRILANPAWMRRLGKAHTAKRQARPLGAEESVRAWRELDCSSSSDALLMNVFCYPRVWTPGLKSLLGVSSGQACEFGYKPRTPLLRGLKDRTEIDLRLPDPSGDLFIEAKLTESDFQWSALLLLERYRDLDEVFDRDAFELSPRGVRSYQLLRGVLAAHAHGARFCVLCDQRRPDLVDAWYGVMRAVRSFELQARLRLLTWQEVARCVPPSLQAFLAAKYGIVPT